MKKLEIYPQPETDKKVEVIILKKETECMIANGILICRCGKCETEEYKLPKDFKKLINNQLT